MYEHRNNALKYLFRGKPDGKKASAILRKAIEEAL